MRDYLIMTDSCCDLSQQEVDELGVSVLPLSFTIDGRTYLNTPDHAAMAPEDFFRRVADGAVCTTAAVNVGEFTDAMRPVLESGRDILCICFSSALSTTYQSACIAADDLRSEYPEEKIIVIDSLSASRGQGMLVYRAVQERRRSDPDIETLANYVRSILQSQCHWFIVDDLNHLKRGGRVSASAAFVGTMLGIKPVMHTDSEGRLIPMGKARGTKAALNGIGRENYTVRAGDVLNDKKLAREFGGEYDIVVANIVADVIIGLALKVRSLLKEGGLFLCSGIIDDRAEEVAGALRAAGWTIMETRESEGWFSYLCK